MDAVTYPEQSVQNELNGYWLTVKIDVEQREGVADRLGVKAIPTAIAIDPDGNLLGELLGFIDAETFAPTLAKLRAK